MSDKPHLVGYCLLCAISATPVANNQKRYVIVVRRCGDNPAHGKTAESCHNYSSRNFA
jgi:hypothetical protein